MKYLCCSRLLSGRCVRLNQNKDLLEIYCNIRTGTESVNPCIRLDTRSTSILKSWPVYTFLSFCVDMWFSVYCSCDLCLKVLWPKIYIEMGTTLLRKIWKLNCKIFYSVLIILFWLGSIRWMLIWVFNFAGPGRWSWYGQRTRRSRQSTIQWPVAGMLEKVGSSHLKKSWWMDRSFHQETRTVPLLGNWDT